MTDPSNSRWEGLCEFVRQEMEKEKIPGVALGVLHGGEVFTTGFGVTSVENPLPVTEETLFQIGSITKTFTATAVMRFIEKGVLDLDKPVRTVLPEFRVADETTSACVTPRHVLTHTAGWDGDLFIDTGSGEDALAKYVSAMAAQEQIAPVGAYFAYNNSAFCLAGHLIEKAAGKSYPNALRELVFEPLGMQTTFFEAEEVISRRFAVGHSSYSGQPQVARPWALPRSLGPAGGIICTVGDLLRYARFHLGNGTSPDGGTRLLSAEALEQMHSPQAPIYGEESIGLGWNVEERNGLRLISHGGGTNGQMSRLVLAPKHDWAMAIFTNADSGGELVHQAVQWALKSYLGWESVDPPPYQGSPEEFEQLTGRYASQWVELELGILAGRLVGEMVSTSGFPTPDSPPPPPSVFGLRARDRLVVLNGSSVGFTYDVIFKPDGSPGWLRVDGRLLARR